MGEGGGEGGGRGKEQRTGFIAGNKTGRMTRRGYQPRLSFSSVVYNLVGHL